MLSNFHSQLRVFVLLKLSSQFDKTNVLIANGSLIKRISMGHSQVHRLVHSENYYILIISKLILSELVILKEIYITHFMITTQEQTTLQPQQTTKQQNSCEEEKSTQESFKLSDITPVNLQEQKKLFFETECKTNPQFTYNRFLTEIKSVLNTQHLDTAIRILKIKRSTLNKKEEILSKETIIQKVGQYIQKIGLKQQVKIVFDQNTVSRTKVKHYVDYSVVIIRDPPSYTQSILNGVLNHQIGTHIVRKFNDRKQSYYKHRKRNGLSPYRIEIQEGLAVLNQLLQEQNPLLFTASLRYLASNLASNSSFCEVYQQLFKYLQNKDEAWNQTVRVKRSLTDTSQKGGFYKDQAYFLGSLEILKARKDIDFIKLHGGKVNLQDIYQVSTENIIRPVFLDNQYLKKLDRISEFNGIQ